MVSSTRSFYRRALTTEGTRRFEAAPRVASLSEEIALVRLRICALAEQTEPEQEPTLQQQRLLLGAIDLLARLIRIQSHLQPDQEDLLGQLNEAVLRKLESDK